MTNELAAGRPRGRDEAVQLWRPPDGPRTAQAIARLGASTQNVGALHTAFPPTRILKRSRRAVKPVPLGRTPADDRQGEASDLRTRTPQNPTTVSVPSNMTRNPSV